jgi:large subunit ribosomal protein L3
MQGLIGKKIGMTQVFDADGHRVAVTVIEAGPCVVVQRKTQENDGYDAVQLGYGDTTERRTTGPLNGSFKKAGVTPKRVLKEFGVDTATDADVKPGDTVSVALFEGATHVDVSGVTKGRGFAGVVRRYRMAGGPKTHGGHSKRRIGSIGQCSYPARVQKGKRMPGHMGHVARTQQSLRVVAIRPEDNVLLVRGAIPGPTGGIVVVKKALKKAGKAS